MKALAVLAASLIVGGALTSPVYAQTPDLEACSTPGLPIDASSFDLADVITVTEAQPIADLQVGIEISHSFVGDLTVSLAHEGTNVVLHNGQGSGADDLRVLFRDDGAANGTEPYDCDCGIRPSGPGELSDFAGGETDGDWEISVLDNFPDSDDGFFFEWCLRSFETPATPPPPPVQNLLCSSTPGSGTAQLFWIASASYDAFEVFLEDDLLAVLPGTITSFTTPPLIVPSINELSVRGLRAGVSSPPRSCTVTVTSVVDAEACAQPRATISEFLPAVSPVVIKDNFAVGDIQVDIDITHTFIGDLQVDLISPGQTSVRLHDGQGFGAQSLRATYWEFGVPNGSVPYDCDCLLQPSGPGTLVDFLGVASQGVWRLTVVDQFFGDSGVLHRWCIRLYQNVPVFPVANLSCDVAAEPGTVEVTWDNPVPYDSIEVLVNGVVDGVVTGPFDPGSSSTYITSALGMPGPAEICVRPSLSGSFGSTQCCELLVSLAPVRALDLDTSSGVAELTWVNPTDYDSISIFEGGNLIDTLPGTETTYTAPALPIPTTTEYCVVASRNDFGDSESACLTAFILEQADLTACSTPYAAISDVLPPVVDTITISADEVILDLEVTVSITHTFVGDLDVDLTSPSGTSLRLHDQGGTDNDNLSIQYTDSGASSGSLPFDCGCAMQPSGTGGLGALSDFTGESTLGDWTLTVTDNTDLDEGTLDQWCVRFVQTCSIVPPADLTCSESEGTVQLDWINVDSYTQIELRRNGLAIATLPGVVDSFTDSTPGPGVYSYQVIGLQAGADCEAPSRPCSIAFGITDVIYRGELPGLVDSVTALASALESPDRVIQVVESFDAATVAVGPELRAIWIALGTYPANRALTAEEGFFLTELHTGDLGLDGTIDREPTPVYFEAGDAWGFDAPTAFSDYDGVMSELVEDGDDSLLNLVGQNSLLGLDLSETFDSPYSQDQAGNDFTDRLIAAQFEPDLGGTAVGVIWKGGFSGAAYNVGLYYRSTIAPVIAQSFEFGGYQGGRDALAEIYAQGLAGELEPGGRDGDPFRRGDWDGDGAVLLGDPINVLSFIFDASFDTPPACADSADANDDGALTIADAITLLGYIFNGDTQPAPPPPGALNCGDDPTPDSLPECDYDGCP